MLSSAKSKKSLYENNINNRLKIVMSNNEKAAKARSPITVDEASDNFIPFFTLKYILTNSPVIFPVGITFPAVWEIHEIIKHQKIPK